MGDHFMCRVQPCQLRSDDAEHHPRLVRFFILMLRLSLTLIRSLFGQWVNFVGVRSGSGGALLFCLFSLDFDAFFYRNLIQYSARKYAGNHFVADSDKDELFLVCRIIFCLLIKEDRILSRLIIIIIINL